MDADANANANANTNTNTYANSDARGSTTALRERCSGELKWNYLELNGMLNGIWDFKELFGTGDAN